MDSSGPRRGQGSFVWGAMSSIGGFWVLRLFSLGRYFDVCELCRYGEERFILRGPLCALVYVLHLHLVEYCCH
jgi:hypothetical protein